MKKKTVELLQRIAITATPRPVTRIRFWAQPTQAITITARLLLTPSAMVSPTPTLNTAISRRKSRVTAPTTCPLT